MAHAVAHTDRGSRWDLDGISMETQRTEGGLARRTALMQTLGECLNGYAPPAQSSPARNPSLSTLIHDRDSVAASPHAPAVARISCCPSCCPRVMYAPGSSLYSTQLEAQTRFNAYERPDLRNLLVLPLPLCRLRGAIGII